MLRYIAGMIVLIVGSVPLQVWAEAPAGVTADIPVANASFEAAEVDPTGWGGSPSVEGWLELDLDAIGSQNTGVFLNTPAGSWDHVANAEGKQLAFLHSFRGNALEQDLEAVYQTGCDYRLTVGVGVSARFPPSAEVPVDTIAIVLYYLDDNQPVDIVQQTVEPKGLSSTRLQDFSVYLPTVHTTDAWAGKKIGVAIRAAGAVKLPGGFWDLDNVRLAESLQAEQPASASQEGAP